MPYKDIEDRRACAIRYNRSEKGKEAAKRYRQTQKGKNSRRRYEKNNPEKKSAHYYARRIPLTICSMLGCDVSGERHHPDYSKPLEVVSLCKEHHTEVVNA